MATNEDCTAKQWQSVLKRSNSGKPQKITCSNKDLIPVYEQATRYAAWMRANGRTTFHVERRAWQSDLYAPFGELVDGAIFLDAGWDDVTEEREE